MRHLTGPQANNTTYKWEASLRSKYQVKRASTGADMSSRAGNNTFTDRDARISGNGKQCSNNQLHTEGRGALISTISKHENMTPKQQVGSTLRQGTFVFTGGLNRNTESSGIANDEILSNEITTSRVPTTDEGSIFLQSAEENPLEHLHLTGNTKLSIESQ